MKNLAEKFGFSPADLAEMEALDKRVAQAKERIAQEQSEEETQKFLEDFIAETDRLWGAQ